MCTKFNLHIPNIQICIFQNCYIFTVGIGYTRSLFCNSVLDHCCPVFTICRYKQVKVRIALCRKIKCDYDILKIDHFSQVKFQSRQTCVGPNPAVQIRGSNDVIIDILEQETLAGSVCLNTCDTQNVLTVCYIKGIDCCACSISRHTSQCNRTGRCIIVVHSHSSTITIGICIDVQLIGLPPTIHRIFSYRRIKPLESYTIEQHGRKRAVTSGVIAFHFQLSLSYCDFIGQDINCINLSIDTELMLVSVLALLIGDKSNFTPRIVPTKCYRILPITSCVGLAERLFFRDIVSSIDCNRFKGCRCYIRQRVEVHGVLIASNNVHITTCTDSLRIREPAKFQIGIFKSFDIIDNK